MAEQAAAVAGEDASPVELVEEALAAIERSQPALNAFTHVLAEDARARAKELESSEPVGPLHGVPVAVKELYDITGVPTTGCCAAYVDRVAASDAAVVERLRAAGAIIVAKTNQHELAYGGTSLISSFGPVRNPWDPERTAGGSSGGSGAAVAARAVAMAMGSDTAGSIRHPASFCGVTGLKTTHGAVSLRGMMALAPSLDSAGPLAVSAQDCAITLRVIAGFDPADPWSRRGEFRSAREVTGLRIGIPMNWLERLAADTRAALEAAARTFADLGAEVVDVTAPDTTESLVALSPFFVSEFADAYRDLWDDERVDPEGARILAAGRSLAAPDLAMGTRNRLAVRREWEATFTRADAVLAPGTPFPAPRAADAEIEVESGTLPNVDVEYARFSMPVNAAGLPSLAFPSGFGPGGLPLGAQLIGPEWSEETLLAAGIAFQRVTDWHLRRPPAL